MARHYTPWPTSLYPALSHHSQLWQQAAEARTHMWAHSGAAMYRRPLPTGALQRM